MDGETVGKIRRVEVEMRDAVLGGLIGFAETRSEASQGSNEILDETEDAIRRQASSATEAAVVRALGESLDSR